ncbi:hypothetical protein CPC08DRAFT_740806 [Agrocybe pediades]|nr:hypothetical protein CPC08DRAFT_740806 [Agrocybe pediades]
MAELASLRAEIKAWERSFKESNGRTPTVDDIKQNPLIANKYKLYKKLGKETASSTSSTTTTRPAHAPEPPSTPRRAPRVKDPTSVLLSKSRAIQPAAPLAAFNPFSPQKKQKGKEKEKLSPNRSHESQSNPFVNANPSARVSDRSHSPNRFPPIPLAQASSSSNLKLNPIPAPGSAVSRARKRLRGEPVSPSPNKDKRRRVSLQTTLPFPRLNTVAQDSDEDEEDDLMDAESSFVGDSPVKAPSGKSYTQLFDEKPMSVDLFGAKSKSLAPKHESDRAYSRNGKTLTVRDHGKPAAGPSGFVSNPEPKNPRLKSKLPSQLNEKDGNSSTASSTRSSAKRVFSDEDNDEVAPTQRPKSPLIPPSPPPPDNSSSNRTGKFKSKTLDAGSRKKAKLDETQVESGSEDAESQEVPTRLRIVSRQDMRRQQAAAERDDEDDAVLSDPDPIFGYTRFAAPHVSPQQPADADEGTVQMDLPDELRRVLALESVSSKGKSTEENRILQGLLYGRRAHHYDPNKGGEIWDVGEDDENTANTEGEDDWEGEPVSWEVGEL